MLLNNSNFSSEANSSATTIPLPPRHGSAVPLVQPSAEVLSILDLLCQRFEQIATLLNDRLPAPHVSASPSTLSSVESKPLTGSIRSADLPGPPDTPLALSAPPPELPVVPAIGLAASTDQPLSSTGRPPAVNPPTAAAAMVAPTTPARPPTVTLAAAIGTAPVGSSKDPSWRTKHQPASPPPLAAPATDITAAIHLLGTIIVDQGAQQILAIQSQGAQIATSVATIIPLLAQHAQTLAPPKDEDMDDDAHSERSLDVSDGRRYWKSQFDQGNNTNQYDSGRSSARPPKIGTFGYRVPSSHGPTNASSNADPPPTFLAETPDGKMLQNFPQNFPARLPHMGQVSAYVKQGPYSDVALTTTADTAPALTTTPGAIPTPSDVSTVPPTPISQMYQSALEAITTCLAATPPWCITGKTNCEQLRRPGFLPSHSLSATPFKPVTVFDKCAVLNPQHPTGVVTNLTLWALSIAQAFSANFEHLLLLNPYLVLQSVVQRLHPTLESFATNYLFVCESRGDHVIVLLSNFIRDISAHLLQNACDTESIVLELTATIRAHYRTTSGATAILLSLTRFPYNRVSTSTAYRILNSLLSPAAKLLLNLPLYWDDYQKHSANGNFTWLANLVTDHPRAFPLEFSPPTMATSSTTPPTTLAVLSTQDLTQVYDGIARTPAWISVASKVDAVSTKVANLEGTVHQIRNNVDACAHLLQYGPHQVVQDPLASSLKRQNANAPHPQADPHAAPQAAPQAAPPVVPFAPQRTSNSVPPRNRFTTNVTTIKRSGNQGPFPAPNVSTPASLPRQPSAQSLGRVLAAATLDTDDALYAYQSAVQSGAPAQYIAALQDAVDESQQHENFLAREFGEDAQIAALSFQTPSEHY
jgi:hypothetical protein